MLQDDAEIARGIVSNFLNRIENGEEPAALESFRSNIKYEVDDLMPSADGNSGFYMDTPIADVEFRSVQIVHDGDGYDLTIVESSKDAVVARVPIQIEARATAAFEFQIKDEGDYLPVASGSGDMTWKFEAGAVFTISGDYTSKPPALELDDVELVDAPKSVDFGYVEIDIHPDDRYGD
jgi:hypothetical protein